MTRVEISDERWPIRGRFTISRGSKTDAHVVMVALSRDGATGRGECVPYAHYGETVDGVKHQIEQQREPLEAGADRTAINAAMPPGAARNAIDCALWDLECKLSGRRAWEIAGIEDLRAPVTAYTLSLDTPQRMRESAEHHAHRALLKLKLGGSEDIERVRAVRAGAPDASIIVDANEGWSPDIYAALAPELVALGVAMIEQPLPASNDAALAEIARPVPVCADESCHDRTSLESIVGRYDVINIKLDKTGGVTEALALKADAEAAGLGIMVGCMLATSLAMAPALLLTRGARFVDLDGPLLLDADREPALVYEGSHVQLPDPALWG